MSLEEQLENSGAETMDEFPTEGVQESDDNNENAEESANEAEESTEKESNETSEFPTEAEIDAMSDEEFNNFLESDFDEYLKKGKKESSDKDDSEEDESKETKESDSGDKIDYKEVYKQVFEPLKSRGKEYAPRNIEDIRSLMSKGIDYTQKTQAISHMRKTFESLEKAKIDTERLNFLIDVNNGDKEAIKKLLKEQEVDPLDLDLDNTNYTPKDNILSDEDVEYQETLKDIGEHLPKINEIITEIWDEKSKKELLKSPNLLRGLHEELVLGRFDKIQAQLQLERTFGKYSNVSDLEAYIDIVTKQVNSEKKAVKPNVVKKAVKVDNSDKLRAAPTKSKVTGNKSKLTPTDIFSMSDEEFSKLNLNELLK